jgi:hypothetical protein
MIVGRVGQEKAAGLRTLAGGGTQAPAPAQEVEEMTPNELIGLRHLLTRAGFDCEKGKF